MLTRVIVIVIVSKIIIVVMRERDRRKGERDRERNGGYEIPIVGHFTDGFLVLKSLVINKHKLEAAT